MKKIVAIREKSMTISKEVVGEFTYWNVYNQARDTILSWINNNIQYYTRRQVDEWQLDSIMCFNNDKNKCITLLETRCMRNCKMDDIKYFYGVKIKEQWYFFGGPTLVLPREYYQEDIHTPLTFEKLKQIATMNIYRGYLKKGEKGQWEINELFFSRFYKRDAYNYPFTTQESWEESWLKLCRDNWSKRDTTNYE